MGLGYLEIKSAFTKGHNSSMLLVVVLTYRLEDDIILSLDILKESIYQVTLIMRFYLFLR